MVNYSELLIVAKNRDKARIGLPPTAEEQDGGIAFIIGTAALFKANPIEFDEVFWTGEIVILPFPTEQLGGVINDQLVVRITVPDLPEVADLVDEVADAASIGAALGNWAITRKYRIAARNAFVIKLQKIRLAKARRVAIEAAKPAKQLRAARRAGRVSKSLSKAEPKQLKRVAHLKKIRVIATTVAFRLVFKAVFVVALVIDVVLVTHRTLQGFEEAGLAGGVGGLAGGLVDVATFGLTESFADAVETDVTSLLVKTGETGGQNIVSEIGGAFRKGLSTITFGLL